MFAFPEQFQFVFGPIIETFSTFVNSNKHNNGTENVHVPKAVSIRFRSHYSDFFQSFSIASSTIMVQKMFAFPKQFQFVFAPIIVTCSTHFSVATSTIMVQKMFAFPEQFQFVLGPITVTFSNHFLLATTHCNGTENVRVPEAVSIRLRPHYSDLFHTFFDCESTQWYRKCSRPPSSFSSFSDPFIVRLSNHF